MKGPIFPPPTPPTVMLKTVLFLNRAALFALTVLSLAPTQSIFAFQEQAGRTVQELQGDFGTSVQQVIEKHCVECHNSDRPEADIDLTLWRDSQRLAKETATLQRVAEQLHTGQMPPPEAAQIAASAKEKMVAWIDQWLMLEAERYAGDPGPVILRRLNNAEYTYSIRDLTGVSSLNPASEFPADSAAGEGFSNTGAALVMSPSLVRKYLDAAKGVAEHAVLLPGGITFSERPSAADMTNAKLDEIRAFYSQFTDQSGGATVNLQGIVFETNQGGRLPVERYLQATLELRDAIIQDSNLKVDDWIARVAAERKLSSKYLRGLWDSLHDTKATGLLKSLQQQWSGASAASADSLFAFVMSWQQALWKFSSVGHIGKRDGPKSWQEPVNPIRQTQDMRLALTPLASGKPANEDVTVYLQIADAGDGGESDALVISNPRLIAPGRPDLPLRGLDSVVRTIATQQRAWVSQTSETLVALDQWLEATEVQSLAAWGAQKDIPVPLLKAWAETLGITEPGETSAVSLDRRLLTQKGQNLSGISGIDGWVAEDALSIIANATDAHHRIPGNMPGKSIAVHPSPSRGMCVGWRAPEGMRIQTQARIRHAHTDCGNGIAWRLEYRRGAVQQVLGAGFSNGGQDVPIGPFAGLRLRANEEIVLVIEPRDANHSCDLTNIDLTVTSDKETWNLTEQLHPNLLAGNPHADAKGRPDVWSFFTEPARGVSASAGSQSMLASGSLLANWLHESDPHKRAELAQGIEAILVASDAKPAVNAEQPDAVMARELLSATGPFFRAAMSLASQGNTAVQGKPASQGSEGGAAQGGSVGGSENDIYGISEGRFGTSGIEGAVDSNPAVGASEMLVRAPAVFEIKLPAWLANGTELVASAMLHPTAGKDGSVQVVLSGTRPTESTQPIPKTSIDAKDPNWTNVSRQLNVASPILVSAGSGAETRTREGFDRFRELFPIALCYSKIVPVDEVVTLTLFYREDDALRRLMLDEGQARDLDRLWSELHFVSQDALKSVDAYEQLWQFATQDADPSAFEPLREPIKQAAEVFRKSMREAEPVHLQAVIDFAQRAYRQPLNETQRSTLRNLYAQLRGSDTGHEEAIRLLIARVLVAPEFLYRTEVPKADSAESSDITTIELANRLSYFLWASTPDDALMRVALDGSLREPQVLKGQVQRMLKDPKSERMAVEFGTMWLHIRDLDQLDEKSETHFPEFREIRHELYRESVMLLTDALASDRSILDLLSGDYTFLNERLARFYGIENVTGDQWRRVEGVRKYGRGGVLTLGATLAKQSGASRTSPILRGNWLCEVILGEKLPKPPKNVPVLSELPPEGMTERELTELHSSEESCAKCHRRIDPYGFSLENYDAIGRYRSVDTAGHPIDAKTKLPDGHELSNARDLLAYIEANRRDDFVKQFNRKLLGYALGRSVQLSDEPMLRGIHQSQQKNGYSLGDTIFEIVTSKPFQQIRGREYRDESSHQ